jgi:Tol biopolymer transport system component/DNA-binding winged helix-turn-helix (wHTH) protein
MEMLTEKKFTFADFELDGARRRLFKQGEAVALNSRTFDLLLVLVERRGEILSKDELLEIVWKGQFVEEGNLTVHISNLRKLLGEKKDEHQFIVTIPGRGYRFIAEIKNETIVESHSLTQIVVEEEVAEDEKEKEETIGTGKSSLVRAVRGRSFFVSKKIAAGIIVALLGLAIGGYFLRNSWSKKSENWFHQMSIRQITTKGTLQSAALSPDGKLFVFSIPEGEQESLWVGHVEGGEPVQIRPPADVIYLSLKFTPDGNSIYYTVGENFGIGTLYKLPVFGGAPQKIHDNISRFSFAPGGQRIAFVVYDEKRGKSILMSADPEGGSEQEITVLPGETGSNWSSPAWSPDGLKIALTANVKLYDSRIFVVNTADGAVTALSPHGWRLVGALNWLHDGSGLVAIGIEPKSLLQQVWLITFPDGEVRRLTTDLSDYGFVTSFSEDDTLLVLEGISQSNIWVAPAGNLKEAKQITFGTVGRRDGWSGLTWTADGRILFTASTNDGMNIWIMNADGSRQKQLIPNGGINNFPSVTSDGRFLVFQSNRSGHYAVWRADLDGGNMIRLTGDQVAGQPFVSPDGKWVIYNSNDDGTGDLQRISIDGGEPLRLTDKPAGWAQISPDSQFVACSLRSADKESLAIISINGGASQKLFEMPRLANLRQGIHWTPDGKALTYRDWKNGIWRQDLSGGAPQHIENLPEERLGSFGWSPDGKLFAYTRILTNRDVVLLTASK